MPASLSEQQVCKIIEVGSPSKQQSNPPEQLQSEQSHHELNVSSPVHRLEQQPITDMQNCAQNVKNGTTIVYTLAQSIQNGGQKTLPEEKLNNSHISTTTPFQNNFNSFATSASTSHLENSLNVTTISPQNSKNNTVITAIPVQNSKNNPIVTAIPVQKSKNNPSVTDMPVQNSKSNSIITSMPHNSKNNTVIRAMPAENQRSVNITPSQAQQTSKNINTVTVKNPSVIMKNVPKALSANIQHPGKQ